MHSTNLKAELFDIILKQDQHRMAVQQLEQIKAEKLAELKTAVDAEAKDTKGTNAN